MLVKAGEEPDPRSLHTEDGGLRYEVVLEEARTKKMPRPKSAPSQSRNYQDIQTKLQVSSYSIKIKSAEFKYMLRLLRSGGSSLRLSSCPAWQPGRGGRRW